MKICWDNLEKLRFNKETARWYAGPSIYFYYDNCSHCGDAFLGQKNNQFCTPECYYVSEQRATNVMDREVSLETRSKIREARRGWKYSPAYKTSKSLASTGNKNPNWKGGVVAQQLPLFDTYAYQLIPYEECRRSQRYPSILEVRCLYCGKWFVPTMGQASRRVQHINKDTNKFYCSPGCKDECPSYRRKFYYKGRENIASRELQPELRRLVFKRDNYTCQRCGSKDHLHCHHIEPVISNPIESADVDQGITFCKTCHEWIHKYIPGCNYYQLANCDHHRGVTP